MIAVEPSSYLSTSRAFYYEYSLTRMSPAEYILNPLFEDLPRCEYRGRSHTDRRPRHPRFIHKLKQEERPIAMVSHNAQFDMSIMSWRYDFHPTSSLIPSPCHAPCLAPSSLAPCGERSPLLQPAAQGHLIREVKGMGGPTSSLGWERS
jgi:hypothetical protein